LAIAAVALPWLTSYAGQNDPRLAALFDKLKSTKSETEAKAAEVLIWHIWTENGNAEIDRLMMHGISAMSEDDEEEALESFNAVVKADKKFAEGWNKRATVEFLMGNFEASVADIERTLALEPRHFGALSGLGQIYMQIDRKPLALKAFRAALAINPHLNGVREKIEELKKDVEGDPI
ncbi:MAG TPA: tetratricopeptide repeat protein, partial [Stellaceae bacterium]|nr:tetratricopeptide repeat protein [Stellaceae bacterium]